MRTECGCLIIGFCVVFLSVTLAALEKTTYDTPLNKFFMAAVDTCGQYSWRTPRTCVRASRRLNDHEDNPPSHVLLHGLPLFHQLTGHLAKYGAIDVPYPRPVSDNALYGEVRPGDMSRAHQHGRLYPVWPHRPATGIRKFWNRQNHRSIIVFWGMANALR